MDMLCNHIMLHGDVSVLNRGNANGSRTQCVVLVKVTAQRGEQQHYAELFTQHKAAKTEPFCLWAYCFNFNFSVRENIFTPFLAFQLPSFILHSCCLWCSHVFFSSDNYCNGVQTPVVAGGSPSHIFNGYGLSCPKS